MIGLSNIGVEESSSVNALSMTFDYGIVKSAKDALSVIFQINKAPGCRLSDNRRKHHRAAVILPMRAIFYFFTDHR